MIPILYEDNHCLAVDKPAGLLSQSDATGDPSVVDLARAYLKTRYNKPGNVYLGLLHRLDRPVSGVLLLAKTSKAAARLSASFRAHDVAKRYLAVVQGLVPLQEGVWEDSIAKDTATNRARTVDLGEGKHAELGFRVLRRAQDRTLVLLAPKTGRGHQLRVQLSSRGLPILGDTKYGASSTLDALDGRRRIALHAFELAITHPTRRQSLVVRSPVPADWPAAMRPDPASIDR